jgi:hypothetical protein
MPLHTSSVAPRIVRRLPTSIRRPSGIPVQVPLDRFEQNREDLPIQQVQQRRQTEDCKDVVAQCTGEVADRVILNGI